MTHNVFRDGRVHVCRAMCKTCIFHPGNRMDLMPGRVEWMVAAATADDAAIVCHSTLGTGANAVCRGFFEHHATAPLQVAHRLGMIEWQDVPNEAETPLTGGVADAESAGDTQTQPGGDHRRRAVPDADRPANAGIRRRRV